ncbi:MAG: hypothetical protein JO283_05195 [Bradyrhizobium sp.]|nr:hypothetical protein [Bradyrhizobium sp.]
MAAAIMILPSQFDEALRIPRSMASNFFEGKPGMPYSECFKRIISEEARWRLQLGASSTTAPEG